MDAVTKISLQTLKYVICPSKMDANYCFIQEDRGALPWEDIYSFYSRHAIASLAVDLLKYIPDDYSNLNQTWKNTIYYNTCNYYRLLNSQTEILKHFQEKEISVVVLKGTSVAKYYPKPQLRTLGDIDLLVKPEDYERAIDCLIQSECHIISCQSKIETRRHISFYCGGISVELHSFFSPHADSDEEKKLDTLLYTAISPDSSVLPDEKNGLVLLSHIRQHLEGGLGLRQIIDWLLFVRTCLDDEMWYSSFQENARLTGLETLAITVTRMGGADKKLDN